MPAFSSTMRTVPGGNSGGPELPALGAGPLLTGGASVVEPPTSAATTTTTTRASAPSPSSHRVRLPAGGVSLVISSSSDSQRGACCGMVPSAIPGPAGVVTSDQAPPFHHRAVPGAPSGSAYQPGGGGDGAVMTSR